MLHEFIRANRPEIIRRCRTTAHSDAAPPSTPSRIDHGVPVFLDQLVDTLRLDLATSPEISNSAIKHGHDLLRRGFTVSQVVHTYGDVCQAITELALDMNEPVATHEFRTLNRCLDEAIAGAVAEYGRERQSDMDQESARATQRLGFFAHEVRNLSNTAMLAFDVLKTGNVGVVGSTGAVLGRSLAGLRTLIDRSLVEVRLAQGIQHRASLDVSEFIQELTPAAALDAANRDVRLTVLPVESDVTIEADRQILAAVVQNLLHNAFKFTRPRTTVTLRVGGSADRVLIEVHDECGGLPSGNVDDLFRPFEQRSADRTGLGLGLAFSRWGAEANDGRVYARSIPSKGCVFTIDLPRLPIVMAGAVSA